MKRLIGVLFLSVVLFVTPAAIADGGEIDYPHFMYRMEVSDFGDDFKTVGKLYDSLPIIVPYGVSGPEDHYNLIKRESNVEVYIQSDGYAGRGENSFATLVNAVEAYFGADAAAFVRENFDYTEFMPEGKTEETIGDYTFGFTKGNNHSGYHITIKREPIFTDLIMTDEELETYRSVEVSAVIELYGEGIINGVGGGRFDPDSSVTRAQYATMLARMLDVGNGEYRGTFSDVPEGQWYTGAVEAFAEMGYILGYGDGTFHPEDTVSYQDMFVIAHRYLDDNGLLPELYGTHITISEHVGGFSDYAKTAIDELYDRSLIRYPYLETAKEPATRIHTAEFLSGIRGYLLWRI